MGFTLAPIATQSLPATQAPSYPPTSIPSTQAPSYPSTSLMQPPTHPAANTWVITPRETDQRRREHARGVTAAAFTVPPGTRSSRGQSVPRVRGQQAMARSVRGVETAGQHSLSIPPQLELPDAFARTFLFDVYTTPYAVSHSWVSAVRWLCLLTLIATGPSTVHLGARDCRCYSRWMEDSPFIPWALSRPPSREQPPHHSPDHSSLPRKQRTPRTGPSP